MNVVLNFWSKFSYGSLIHTPIGCLANAEGSRLMFFERSTKSPKNNIKVYTHQFYTNHLGGPTGWKSSIQVCLEEAWRKWHNLQEQGWTEVSQNFN